MAGENQRFTKEFWVLCSVVFVYFISFNLIIPQLPNYITQLGGARYKGLIIGVFALSALGTRPFSGKLIDFIGRKPIMLLGILVSVLVLFTYPIAHGVFVFLTLRFIHGISAGCTPTATTAFCSDIVPVSRRGEAMGIVGMSGNLGMSLGPALGSEVAIRYNNETMFIVGGVIALVAMLPAWRLKESLPTATGFKPSMLKLRLHEVIEKRVLVQGLVMTLTVITFGALLTLVPDYCSSFGIRKNGYFFSVVTLTSLGARVVSGKLSDKFGREVVILVGVLVLIVANILLILASSAGSVFVAAAVFGLATGINSPTLFAWTIDNGDPKFIGRGISTLFIFLEFGIIIGSVVPAEIYQNRAENIPKAFMFTLVCAIAALLLVLRAYSRRNRSLESF
ncbi:MAG: MFS transporter [Bacteroidia bacterium]|nr:MFS transporter [Bacteroidia bacterium]